MSGTVDTCTIWDHCVSRNVTGYISVRKGDSRWPATFMAADTQYPSVIWTVPCRIFEGQLVTPADWDQPDTWNHPTRQREDSFPIIQIG